MLFTTDIMKIKIRLDICNMQLVLMEDVPSHIVPFLQLDVTHLRQ